MSFNIKTGAKGPTITITRGDSASFHIDIIDSTGEAYELQDGDIVTFTVKKSTKTTDIVMQKTGQDIAIDPSDTADLKYGTYVYDIQLTYAGGGVDTFIGPAVFEVTEEVTF